MAYVQINPRYRETLTSLRINSAEALLSWPAVAVSGHPERNVSRIRLGALDAFVKCEHRVRLRDRLANALAGFGPISKSAREAQVLNTLRAQGVGCPDWIAHGQDGAGRAFLIVRALTGYQDLRRFLHERRDLPDGLRCRLAESLGSALTRIHDAGFEHADLFSKHVLIHPQTEEICFLDWQRSRRHEFVPWSIRCAELAALDATLADELASPRERLLSLLAYLRAHERSHVMPSAHPPSLKTVLQEVQARSQAIFQKRRVREQRLPVAPAGSQEIVRLDGEALCLTRSFWEELHRWSPEELSRLRQRIPARGSFSQEVVNLPGGRTAVLTQRRSALLFARFWAALRRRRQESPELQQACRLNRTQQDHAPRLLAYGQRRRGLLLESFLLTELPEQAQEGRRVA